MLVLLTLLTQVALAKIECTATDDSGWSYVEWSKSGGAKPGPESVMHSRTWTKNTAPAYHWQRTYDLGESTTGTLEWRWDASATVKQQAKGTKMYGTQSYTTEVELWGPKQPRQVVPMSCVYSWAYGMP